MLEKPGQGPSARRSGTAPTRVYSIGDFQSDGVDTGE